LSYTVLNEKANLLAQHLINQGAKPDDIIGIYLDKSLEVIVSILAILKVGATYLPIDTAYPDTRINYIIENSKLKNKLLVSKI